ncbi:MAG: OmpA family protein [Planctomycetota bacterium]
MNSTPNRRFYLHAGTALLLSLAWVSALGCNQNPYLAGGPTVGNAQVWQNAPPADVPAGQARISELSRRVQLLDDNNRQLQTQLAQSEQRTQAFQQEVGLLREQLAGMSGQLQSTTLAAKAAESQVRGMVASTQSQDRNAIRPNTNLSQLAATANFGGLPVRADADSIRITIASDQLFAPGTANLLPQAQGMLQNLAGPLRSRFTSNRVGVESYTDTSPMYGGAFTTPHQLTSAQAAAVVAWLQQQGGIPPNQLFTVAQGSAQPIADNQTPSGRASNRRIEVVIYPSAMSRAW